MSDLVYPEPVSKLLTLGDVRGEREWPDYLALGLSAEHVPELIRMARDKELHWADSESAEVWAPLHAWRALAVLHAEDAVKPLVELFSRVDTYDDDWVGEDLPRALGILGPAAIPDLQDYLADASHGLWARIAASASLAEIGKRHPQARGECVAVLAGQLEHFAEMDPALNGFIISYLVELKAVEAAPVIQKAFAAEQVDLGVQGDWEEVQIGLGMIEKRRTPRPRFNFPDLVGPLPRPREEKQETRKPDEKPGRNDPCWCGSGKKYKYCHLRSDQARDRTGLTR